MKLQVVVDEVFIFSPDVRGILWSYYLPIFIQPARLYTIIEFYCDEKCMIKCSYFS